MTSQEGIRKIYTCLCQQKKSQAVCIDVKLLGTTEGIYQNSDILVLLHEYDWFFWVHVSWTYAIMAHTL
jgi:hypothetical protein